MEYIIYGAGYYGLHFCDLLIKNGIKATAILDKDKSLWGKRWKGVPIKSPKTEEGKQMKVIICNADIKICDAIRTELLKDGFAEVESVYQFAQHEKNIGIFKSQRIIICVDEKELEENIDHIEEVRNLLQDEESKRTYIQIIESLKSKSFDGISNRPLCDQYFPEDLCMHKNDEVFIDIGGGPDGDVLKEYLKRYGDNFAHYYLYDCCDYINKLYHYRSEKITIERKAIGDIDSEVYVEDFMGKNALISSDGNQAVNMFRLDDLDYMEKVSFLKIDVEGDECKVIDGAWNMIKKSRPTIAIALYHRLKDFWDIPIYLNSRLSGYSFFLRSYMGVSETILYCIPNNKQNMKRRDVQVYA